MKLKLTNPVNQVATIPPASMVETRMCLRILQTVSHKFEEKVYVDGFPYRVERKTSPHHIVIGPWLDRRPYHVVAVFIELKKSKTQLYLREISRVEVDRTTGSSIIQHRKLLKRYWASAHAGLCVEDKALRVRRRMQRRYKEARLQTRPYSTCSRNGFEKLPSGGAAPSDDIELSWPLQCQGGYPRKTPHRRRRPRTTLKKVYVNDCSLVRTAPWRRQSISHQLALDCYKLLQIIFRWDELEFL